MSRLTYVSTVLVVLALAACTPSPVRSDATSVVTATSSPSSAAATTPVASGSTAASTPPARPRATLGIQAECGTTLAFTEKILEKGTISIPVASIGTGDKVVLLLHQRRPASMCGWTGRVPLFLERGLKVYLFDLCGFGRSACPDDDVATTEQVQLVVDLARKEGARRVTLIGSSFGGTFAVKAAAAVKADAVVDISGPATYFQGNIDVDAATLTMPALFLYSPTDQSDADKVKSRLADMPTKTKKFHLGKQGHGYELLREPEANRLMLAWALGRYEK